MPIMTRMRDSMPVILIGLVVAFVLMIIFEWGMDYVGLTSGGVDHVGKINHRIVSYQEFTELVRQAAEQQKAQMKVDPDDIQMAQIRDQVWNTLVTQALVEEEIKRLSIIVTDQEIIDWVHGDNPPEFLKRQFIDTLGVFNRAAYENALQDPRNREIWLSIEQSLREQLRQQKLQSLLFASVRATDAEIFRRFLDQNVRADAEYVLFDPTKLISDNEVQVTDADLRKFYNENSQEFKVEATRKLKYVFFREEPSAQDTQVVLSDVEDLLRRVREGAEFLEIAGQYGELRQPEAYFRLGELGPVREEAIFRATVGDLVGPLKDTDGFHLIKILGERQGQDEFLGASHILVPIENNDSLKALRKAHEILAMARKGDDFAELARNHSTDPGSAERGGDLGWFGKGKMVKPFEDAAFAAPLGRVVGPVRTQFGYHLIKVTGKTKRELRIADLILPVKVSSQTRNEIFERALDFNYLAKGEDFTKEAERLGYQVVETPAFTKGSAIPGIGMSETISKFAFGESVGDISDVISLPSGYGVFMVSEVKKAGVRPFDDVKSLIQPRVLREKKLEKVKAMAEEFHNTAKNAGDLRAAAAERPNIQVQNTGSFLLSGFVPGVGTEPAFIGAVSALKVGELSKPFKGNRGYYIVKLLDKTEVDTAAFERQRESLRDQITQEKRSRFVTEWLEHLKKNATIEDNREMFFR